MADLAQKRKIVRQLLTNFAIYPPTNANIREEPIVDTENDRYMLVTVGWDGDRRIHHCTLHLSIIDEKIHIEANNTDRSIAQHLANKGIDPNDIVLALQPPDLREPPHVEQKTTMAELLDKLARINEEHPFEFEETARIDRPNPLLDGD